MKFVKTLVQIVGAFVLGLLVIFLVNYQHDDPNMATFKQSVAGFIRGDKQAASVGDVLGVSGEKICISYPYRMETKGRKTVKHQLIHMFPNRAGDIDKLKNNDDESELVIGIENGKDMTVMTGKRKVVVDGKSWVLAVKRDKATGRESGFGCFNFAVAKFSKAEYPYLLLGDMKGAEVKKSVTEKPKQKKKLAPAPVKKTTKPARSYGY